MDAAKLLPRYEYLAELGRGGMGRVLLVRDTHRRKDLALKLLHEPPADRDQLERLREEFALLSEIDHPGIARAFDFGYVDDRPYFTTEYIAGKPLGRNGGGECREVAALLHAVVETVAFLHRFGILHLDIKCSNVVVPVADERRRAVLIDFGLCRKSGAALRPSQLEGSLPYMAPEYFGSAALGPWTDVYALGVTCYRLLTGRYPRQPPRSRLNGSDAVDWEAFPRPPSWYNPGVAEDLENVVLKCLTLESDSRFSSAAELLRALDDTLGEPRLERKVAAPATRTVGRVAELRQIAGFLDSLELSRQDSAGAAPEAATLLVTAMSGSGQSHLFREMKVLAQMRGLSFYLESGYPGRAVIPGAPFRCLSAHLPATARARWERFLKHMSRPRRSPLEDAEAQVRVRRSSELAYALRSLETPLVLAIDALQFFDEISVSLIAELVRVQRAPDATALRHPVAVALGYREEGPMQRLLKEISELLLRREGGMLLALGPLGPEETLALYREQTRRHEATPPRGLPSPLEVFQKTGGSPARIVALALSAREAKDPKDPKDPKDASRRDCAPGVPWVSRATLDGSRLLCVLGLLRKPATATEISRLLDRPRHNVLRELERWQKNGLIDETDAGIRQRAWLATSALEESARSLPRNTQRKLHASIARHLLRPEPQVHDPRLLDALHHCREAGQLGRFLKHGFPLAAYLKETLQNRAALRLFQKLREAIPPACPSRLFAVELELAELRARVGELDEGIEGLRRLLPQAKAAAGAWHARLLLRLAMLYSRHGDFRRAETLFSEGLAMRRDRRVRIGRREFLHFLNEHAALKAVVGEREKALALCAEGMRLCANRLDDTSREVLLNLHATRASLALRNFECDEALADFERAFEIADALGSSANRAVVLNNLGIVHHQNESYEEAIRSFRQAEAACRQLDAGPSLTFVYGNLAVLYAKQGEFDGMEEALAQARKFIVPAAGRAVSGRREELFLEHHQGLGLLYRGRPMNARKHFERAILVGGDIGDRLVTLFDRVYRVETLLLTGSYTEARSELEELTQEEAPGRVRLMSFARLALFHAVAGDLDAWRHALGEHARLASAEHPVPFLDTWDDTIVGWSCNFTGESEGVARLESAEERFRRKKLWPSAALCAWLLGEAAFLRGDEEGAWKALRRVTSANELVAVLKPLLTARLLMENAKSGALKAKDRERCADCLAEAGAALIGNPLPEWSLRVDGLRRRFQREEDGGAAARFDERRGAIARALSAPARVAYLESRHWERWVGELQTPELEKALVGRRADARQRRTDSTRVEADTRATKHSLAQIAAVRGLEAKSPGMRLLVSALDRLHASELPVVICGETGTGKELIARIIHTESRRRSGPFRVLDCATIPGGLLEAELFGATAGAFTDLNEDRAGIVTQAEGGTLLIEALSGAVGDFQAKLLRLLSEGTFRPVGAETERRANLRFLFSTSHDFAEDVRQGRLRRDLFHRIQVLSVQVPPLRERLEDLDGLIAAIFEEGESAPPTFAPGVLERLRENPWPGNVRELRNLILRLRVEHPEHIPLDALDRAWGEAEAALLCSEMLLAEAPLQPLKERLEREYLRFHLGRLRGDVRALSAHLGVSLKHCYRRCSQLGIRVRNERRRREGG